MRKVGYGWLIVVGSFAVLLVGYWKTWFTGQDIFIAVVLLSIAAVVFTYALDVSARQIDAGVRRDLNAARDEIAALKSKIADLEKKAKDSSAAIASLPALGEASTLTAAQVRNVQAAQLNVADLASGTTQASADIGAIYDRFTKATESLPEGHRLSGYWIATGLALVVLAFFFVKDVSIDTTTPSTPTNSQESDPSAQDPSAQDPDGSEGEGGAGG